MNYLTVKSIFLAVFISYATAKGYGSIASDAAGYQGSSSGGHLGGRIGTSSDHEMVGGGSGAHSAGMDALGGGVGGHGVGAGGGHGGIGGSYGGIGGGVAGGYGGVGGGYGGIGGGYGGAAGGFGGGADESPKPFKFDYQSTDERGNINFKREEGDASGNVRGVYGYRDEQGLYREVQYVAGPDGFKASVKTNEPGTDNKENPADVQMQVEESPAGLQEKWTAKAMANRQGGLGAAGRLGGAAAGGAYGGSGVGAHGGFSGAGGLGGGSASHGAGGIANSAGRVGGGYGAGVGRAAGGYGAGIGKGTPLGATMGVSGGYGGLSGAGRSGSVSAGQPSVIGQGVKSGKSGY